MQDLAGLADWIRLDQTSGVGPETARKLLAAFGLPGNIFHASHAALSAIVPARIAEQLAAPPSSDLLSLTERTLDWTSRSGNMVLTLADEQYPRQLLDIPDPPLILYVKGRLELLSRAAIAVVGSRNATTQGMLNAERFSEAMAVAGLTVVSGMALGIDTAAHRGGLQAGPDSASTIAVIGTGADIVYPARNRELAHRIAQDGCIVSEYALGTPGIASNFPRRNRIISGLARGVLVVEAAAQSGSLITARTALEQGREVFAIPGSIHSPLSKGCHQLIKQGAKLVESAQDILEELAWRPTGNVSGPVAAADGDHATRHPEGAKILHAMGFDPVGLDSLAERTGLDAAAISSSLLSLELEGVVETLPGGMVRRVG